MTMVDGCGSGRRSIRCGYHDWRYGLDGALRVVPQRADQFPDLDADALGLLPVFGGRVGGHVFASPDPAAVPLDRVDGRVPPGDR